MNQRQRACLAGVLLAGLFTAGVATAAPHAVLSIKVSKPAERGEPVTLPVRLTYVDTTLTALVFSIDLDTRWLSFDPADADMDGVPDAVILPAGMPSIIYVDYDPDDAGSELDVMLANLSGAPLPQGVILAFELTSVRRGWIHRWIDFAEDPQASFGDAQGRRVDGTTLVLSRRIFADGFESGDTSAWSLTRIGEDG